MIVQICLINYPLSANLHKLPAFHLPTDDAAMNVHLTLAAILVLFFSVALIHV